MASGLYQDHIIVERFSASPAASTLGQVYVAPADLDVLGMLLYAVTAPAGGNAVSVNVSDFPTSQQGGTNASVSAYNLWTATNVPTITGTAHSNFTTSNSTTVIKNLPYPLNYPLPGASGVTGYATAQATAQTTQTPVVTPPVLYEYGTGALVQPDATFVDYNGLTVPAAHVSAGDVLSFVITGASLGSTANLEIVLYAQKR